ncbi:MAG: archemetzincin [Desulfobacteraceae bacterium]|nr:MAG: archemetzincin [Desulfobacteraceae bacterium]
MESPEYAYNETRCQYNSKLILKHLLRQCPSDTLRFIGVTPVDLYVPILKFVFGLAQIEGQYSIISLHRLCPRFYDQPSNPDLLLARLEKAALHELGHTFGITHCRDRRCVMYSSTRIDDTDFKQPDFCLTCFELFRWHLEKALNQNPS